MIKCQILNLFLGVNQFKVKEIVVHIRVFSERWPKKRAEVGCWMSEIAQEGRKQIGLGII